MNGFPELPVATDAASEERVAGWRATGGDALRRFLNAAARWRYWALGTIAVVLAVGALIILLTPPSYLASSTIEISRETVKIAGVEGVEETATGIDQEFYETQYGLLRGKALAQSVVRSLNLAANETFVPEAAQKLSADSVAGRQQRFTAAVTKVQENTQVAPARFSRLVEVRYSDEDPVLAARIANVLVADFIRSNLERRLDRNEYARTFLQQRIDEVRERLQASERRLISYATQQEIISVPAEGSGGAVAAAGQSLAGSDLAAMSTALAEARAARIQAEGRWMAAQRGGANRPEVLQNDAITSLLRQRAELRGQRDQIATNYDDDYPPLAALNNQIAEIDRQIGQISRRILLSLESEYRAAQNREAGLLRQVNARKQDVLDLGRRSIQYNILQRDVDTNRALYDALLQRIKEVGVANDIGSNNVAVILPAAPPENPYSPRPLRIMLLALLAGLLAAVAVLIVRELLDNSLATPEEVAERLQMPLLGSVPKAEVDNVVEAIERRRSAFSEAYSSIMTSLRHVSHSGAPKSLCVTSTEQGEGKSTGSIALALQFARQGERVLLIDADLRKPSLHKRLDLANKVGFSDVLVGKDDYQSSLLQVGDHGLSVLTSGPQPPSAADLLAGSRLTSVIRAMMRDYDRLVFDAPPVLGLADAPLLAAQVEGVVFVVEAGRTRVQTVRRSLKRLRDVGARPVGAILNKFEPRAALFDDYGRYGYYEYGTEKAVGR